jgi:TonB-linked SusC/RagA family outer membrane protein
MKKKVFYESLMHRTLKRLSYRACLLLMIGVFVSMSPAFSGTGEMTSVTQQQVTITGTITDEAGEPIPGVNVVVKGTSIGTVTDIDGKYSIDVPNNDAVLIFSFIGYIKEEQPVGNRRQINVAMKEDAVSLKEIVVTGVAAGTSKKKLSFTVDKLSEENFNVVPGVDAATALQGKVASLQVLTPSGMPGQESSIIIRGATSLIGQINPLVMVDGVLTDGGMRDINTEDIASIEVLKGAAASSLYGSRAANGVIHIITKRGSALDQGKVIITLKTEMGQNYVGFLPKLTGAHWFKTDADGNPSKDTGAGYGQVDDGIGKVPYIMYGDPFKDFFHSQSFYSGYVSLRGTSSNGRTNYFGSYQYMDQGGIIEMLNGYQRRNFRVNLEQRVNNEITIFTSNAFIRSTRDDRFQGGDFDQIFYTDPNVDFYAPNADGTPYNARPQIVNERGNVNPFYHLYHSYNGSKGARFLGSYKISYQPVSFLIFNGTYGIDYNQNSSKQIVERNRVDNRNGSVNVGQSYSYSQNLAIDAMFAKTFNDFNTRIKAQYLYEDNESESVSGSSTSLAVSGMQIINLALGSANINNSSNSRLYVAHNYSAMGFIDYKDKYILDALIRRDGVSLFGPEERWQTYYRLSGAWRVTQDFTIPGIQELKLRGSYGTAGLRPDVYDAQYDVYNMSRGIISSTRDHAGNPKLKPAKSQELELGFDMDFMNRFSFIGSYAKRRNTDQMFLLPAPAETGAPVQYQNVGEFFSNNYEIVFNANILNNKEFSWNAGLTWFKMTQRVGELGREEFWIGDYLRVRSNAPFGELWGQSAGHAYATSLDDVKYSPLIKPGQTVDEVYTINNHGLVVLREHIGTANEIPVCKIAEDGTYERAYYGNITPDFTMNLSNTFTWKGISMYCLMTWQQGGIKYNNSYYYMTRSGLNLIHYDQRNKPFNEMKPWVYYKAEDNMLGAGRPRTSSMEDPSFLRMRELSLAYTFNKSKLNSWGVNFLQDVKLAFIARNLFTLTHYSSPDPESVIVTGNTGNVISEDTPKYPTGGVTLSGSITINF